DCLILQKKLNEILWHFLVTYRYLFYSLPSGNHLLQYQLQPISGGQKSDMGDYLPDHFYSGMAHRLWICRQKDLQCHLRTSKRCKKNPCKRKIYFSRNSLFGNIGSIQPQSNQQKTGGSFQ